MGGGFNANFTAAPPPAAPMGKAGGFNANFAAAPAAAPAAPVGFTGRNPTAPAAQGKGGSLIDTVGKDLRGIGPGLVQLGSAAYQDLAGNPKPIARVAKAYGKSEANNWENFAMTGKPNLGVGLDIATLATLGGAGAARLSQFAVEHGLASDAGRVAAIGQAKDLTVPDLAKQMGQEGNDVILRKSSTNPVTRARQVAVNKVLNSKVVPPGTPMIGSEARLGRAVMKSSVTPGQAFALKAIPLEAAFNRLSKTEQAAWHLRMQQLDPQGWQDLLASKAIGNPKSTEGVMWSKLQGDKLNALYRNPQSSSKLMAALQVGHEASALLTADKVTRGIIDPLSAVERPYLPQRLINDAKVVPPDKATEARPAGITDQPGASIPELAQKLDVENANLPDALRQPSYVPHSAKVDRPIIGQWRGRPGVNPPAKPGSTRFNEGTLLRQGMLNLHKNSLTDEMRLHARFIQRTDTHAALQQVAAKLPEAGLPNGYRLLKSATGEAGLPYTEQAAGALKAEMETKQSLLDRFTTRDQNLADEHYARDAEGHKLIVPDHVAHLLSMEARQTPSMVRDILWNKPTTVWKHLILGLRPAYMVNIIASQHILGALQMAGGRRGVEAYLNHVIPGARIGKLTDATIAETMPEQAAATFSGSTGTVGARGLAAKAYQGVMPATMKAETWLRRLMIEGWAKSEPEIQAAMRANGGDINAAMRTVKASDPHIINEISARVDHAQGNYRTYTPLEQKLRAVVPFYGWDRHIIQSTYRILSERPALANAGVKVGQQGQQQNMAEFGRLPSYLQGIIGIPRRWIPNTILKAEGAGTTPVLESKAFEPFSTDADILNAAKTLVTGNPGAGNDQFSNINPLITAALEYYTGKSLLTGTALKGHIPGGALTNIPARIGLGLPQARLAEQAAGWHPVGASKSPTSSQDTYTQLLALLGLPVKGLNVGRANSLAAKIP